MFNRKPQFEVHGYFKDYYYQGKFYGSQPIKEKDREQLGYGGRRLETLKEDKKFKNRKILKAGTEVKTEIFPVNGKLIK